MTFPVSGIEDMKIPLRAATGWRMRSRCIVPALALLIIASPALAEPITGVPRVVDGDSLVIDGVRIRLHGIDAPERNQTCGAEPETWSCGRAATRALSEMIDRAPVTCHERDVDRYGRVVATCAIGDILLNSLMVAEGWAMAYRRYSTDYVTEEDEARKAGRGIWSGEFLTPEQWRRSAR